MINKKIQDKLKDVVFIELKKPLEIKDVTINNIPLPVRMNSLLEEIKTGDIEEFNLLRVTEGIVFLLGIESDFKYKEEYVKLVKAVHENIKDYILFLSKKYLDLGELIESYIYIKAHKPIVGYDSDLYFTELGILEEIYNKNFEVLEDEEKENIIKELLQGYEEINIKEYYPLADYKLGNINKSLQNYLKSMLYFKKFLNADGYDDLKNEVRNQIIEIEDFARIEEAEAYLSYGKFKEAEMALDKISNSYYEPAKLEYYKSLSNYYQEKFETALEQIEKALKIEKREEYYNHAAMIYIALEDTKKAIDTLLEGIENFNQSYTLNYNLGSIYYNLNDREYKKYLQRAYELNPNDELAKMLNE